MVSGSMTNAELQTMIDDVDHAQAFPLDSFLDDTVFDDSEKNIKDEVCKSSLVIYGLEWQLEKVKNEIELAYNLIKIEEKNQFNLKSTIPVINMLSYDHDVFMKEYATSATNMNQLKSFVRYSEQRSLKLLLDLAKEEARMFTLKSVLLR